MADAPEYSYVAYIDESGDPGLNKVKPRSANGSSEWLVIGCALIPAELEPEMGAWVADLMKLMRSHQMRDLHFQGLGDDRKAAACTYLAGKNVRLFAIVSNKQNMEGYRNPAAEKIPSDNWFYCWMTRVLLERVTNEVAHASLKRHGEVRKVKLEYSERGGLRYSQMRAYYEWINLKSAGGTVPLKLPWGTVDFRVLSQRLMHVYNHADRDGLKLPDIVASAFFKAVDIHDTRALDPRFAKLLSPAMARAPDKAALVSGYGVKLMPNWRTLDLFKVPEAQREILRFYGYPRQWWQPQ